MEGSSTIGVMVVDDQSIVREGLAAIIARSPDMRVVAEATDGAEAFERYEATHPDVTLMDLRMPNSDGTQAITSIRERYPDARIIVLSTFDKDEDIYRGLRAGAKAFLLKDTPREEVLGAVRTVHAGGTHIPEHIAAKLAERLSAMELTERELEVLQLIAAGCSNQEVGNRLFITEGTVKAHVSRILTKLNVDDRTQAVTTALRRGLVSLD